MMIAAAAAMEVAKSLRSKKLQKRYVKMHLRLEKRVFERLDWSRWASFLTDKEFKDRYKMEKDRFADLCEKIRPDVKVSDAHKSNAVPPEICLAATLRCVAGGHRHDISDKFGFRSGSTFYRIFDKTLLAIDKHLDFPSFFGTAEEMDARERGFAAKSRFCVRGCIGAIDGLAIKIEKPMPWDAPAEPYKNRKGFYALNLQAICDANRRFLWFSLVGSGGQHDSLAFQGSQLYLLLEEGMLDSGNDNVHPRFISADNAYACTVYMITPYPGQVGDDDFKDDFNYYLSKMRIEIECAFGMLVNRFGILWKKLCGPIARSTQIVTVCMKLHNYILETDPEFNEPNVTYRPDGARHFDGESFDIYNPGAPDGPYLYFNSGERPSSYLSRVIPQVTHHARLNRDPPPSAELSPDLEAIMAFRSRRAKERSHIRDKLAQHADLRDFIRSEYVKQNRIRRPDKSYIYET